MLTSVGPFATGRLTITDRCISLEDEERGVSFTLLWQEDSVDFDSNTQTASYTGPRLLRTVVLSDNIRLAIQGSEVGLDWERIARKPDRECPQRFLAVSTISVR